MVALSSHAETLIPMTIVQGVDTDKAQVAQRRAAYLRPFVLFWLNSFIVEVFLFFLSIVAFSGFRDLHIKFYWTLLFCPFGMGGTMGGLLNFFVTDRMYGKRAAIFCAILSFLILGACNNLCFKLDAYFDYWGAARFPWWFIFRYPLLPLLGYKNGLLLYTDEGQAFLSRVGL